MLLRFRNAVSVYKQLSQDSNFNRHEININNTPLIILLQFKIFIIVYEYNNL